MAYIFPQTSGEESGVPSKRMKWNGPVYLLMYLPVCIAAAQAVVGPTAIKSHFLHDCSYK